MNFKQIEHFFWHASRSAILFFGECARCWRLSCSILSFQVKSLKEASVRAIADCTIESVMCYDACADESSCILSKIVLLEIGQ